MSDRIETGLQESAATARPSSILNLCVDYGQGERAVIILWSGHRPICAATVSFTKLDGPFEKPAVREVLKGVRDVLSEGAGEIHQAVFPPEVRVVGRIEVPTKVRDRIEEESRWFAGKSLPEGPLFQQGDLKSLLLPVGKKTRGAGNAEEWRLAGEVIEAVRPEALPSEHAVCAALADRVQREAVASLLGRHLLGELALEPLLEQTRPGGAPRWFLYPAMGPCSEVLRPESRTVQFTFMCEGEWKGAERFTVPNPLAGFGNFSAKTILLPHPVRDLAHRLHRRGLPPYVLYEPRHVTWLERRAPSVTVARDPDPALLVRAGRRWFVAALWEDPAVEDPRALNTLREFYVGPSLPAPW